MDVKDVMTTKALRSCSPETKLKEAARIMKVANCGFLPVTDENKKVLGVITDRDICLTLSKEYLSNPAGIQVDNVMGKIAFTVNENDDVKYALKQMRVNKVGRLPVVDHDNKLKGILSLHNMVSHSLDGQEEEGWISAPGENLLKTLKALSDHYSNHESASNKEVIGLLPI